MRAFHYHLLFIVLFSMSCVSSSRYRSMEAHYQQLELQHADLKYERDSLAIRSESLQKTQEQLRKTEETLISFYLKYQNQQDGDPNSPKLEADSSRIQTGRTEQAALKQRIQNLELELQQAKAAPKNKNQEKVSGKKKQDSLNRVLHSLQANLRELQNQLRNRDQEIQTLRANENIADSLLSVNQLLRIQNRNVQEELRDQVALRQDSLISQKEANQRIQKEQDRKIGILQDSLNHLMKMHSGTEENSKAAESKIRQLEEQLQLARSHQLEAEEHANQGLQQERDLKIRVLRDSLHHALSMQSEMEDRSKTAESKIRQLEEQLQLARKQQQQSEEKWNQTERKNKNKKSTDQARLRQLESESNDKDLRISELHNQVKSLEQIVQTTRSQKDSLNEQLLRTQHMNADLKRESGLHQSRADSIRMQKTELIQQQARLAVLDGSLAEQSGRLAELQDTLQGLQDELLRMDLQFKNKEREYRALKEKMDAKNKEVSAPVSYVPQRDSIRQLKKQIEGLQLVLAEQQYQLDKREVKLIRQTEELDSVNAELARLKEKDKTPAIVTAKPDQKKPSGPPEPSAKAIQKNTSGKDSVAVKPNANRPTSVAGKEQVSPSASKPLEKPKIETGSQKNSTLTAEWASKVEQFVKGHASSEMHSIRMDQSMLVIFPKNALFEGDSHAMKQSGTELITAMADLLKPRARLRISIAALGFEKKPGETLQEQSLKRARTVSKLFSIYGWPADKLRIQEKTHQPNQDQPATGSRVEIFIYAD